MTSTIVAKFGGSSVKDSNSILRVSGIVDENPNIKIVVISATQNTTNHLEAISRASLFESDDERITLIKELEDRHVGIAKELYSTNEVIDEIKNLASIANEISILMKKEGQITPRYMDELYSIGERMSSLIVWDLLKLRIPEREVYFLDVRKVMVTDSNFLAAKPIVEEIKKEVNSVIGETLLNRKALIVTQGFIGKDQSGNTTTLGREGSDYSAALLGEAIDADLVQIWTDVEGVASIDPRLTKEAKFMDSISYDEATILATLGAKVLFPSTLAPAKRKNIPVWVGSSLKPNLKGTIINSKEDSEYKLKAVTLSHDKKILSVIGANLEFHSNLVSDLISFLNLDSVSLKDKSKNHISFYLNDNTDVDAIYLKAHDFVVKDPK